MKKIISLIFIAALTASIFVSCDSEPKLKVKNNTGFTIEYIYTSESSAEYYGDEDLLGTFGVILDGETFSIEKNIFTSDETYDFMFVDEDDDAYGVYGVDIANTDMIEVNFEDLME